MYKGGKVWGWMMKTMKLEQIDIVDVYFGTLGDAFAIMVYKRNRFIKHKSHNKPLHYRVEYSYYTFYKSHAKLSRFVDLCCGCFFFNLLWLILLFLISYYIHGK